MNKKETTREITAQRDYEHPSLLKIPKKDPRLNYRWIKNTPENISLMEAKGYKVANSEIVRAAGLTPRGSGAAEIGDLILAVEEYAHHREHKDRENELKNRQADLVKRGYKGSVRKDGYGFSESVREG
jgi:hypothetical protein